jgi:predicted histone-like DNA-binding protein
MSITLKRIERTNPQDRSQSAWYATQETSKSIDLREIAQDIQDRTTLTKADVLAVLVTLEQVLPTYLNKGFSVRLGGFGSFRISVSSAPSPTEQEVTARNVKGARVVFVAGTELKKALANISYTLK